MNKMTNQEAVNVYNGLTELINKKIKLSVRTSYTLARDKAELEKLVQVIEQEQRRIYFKYGTQQLDGSIKVPQEKIEDLNKDLTALMEIPIEKNLFKVRLEDFGDENIEFGTIEKLMPIIEETQE